VPTYRLSGERLARAAADKGDLSGYAIAKRTGLNQTTLSRLRRGMARPATKTLLTLRHLRHQRRRAHRAAPRKQRNRRSGNSSGSERTPYPDRVNSREATSMNILTQATDSRQATPGQAEPAITRATVTVGQIMNLPLDQVLTGLDIRVIESSITDAHFSGAAHIGNGQKITLVMPPGRDEFETDCIVRYLTAQSLGLDVTPLPQPFNVQFVDSTADFRDSWVKAGKA